MESVGWMVMSISHHHCSKPGLISVFSWNQGRQTVFWSGIKKCNFPACFQSWGRIKHSKKVFWKSCCFHGLRWLAYHLYFSLRWTLKYYRDDEDWQLTFLQLEKVFISVSALKGIMVRMRLGRKDSLFSRLVSPENNYSSAWAGDDPFRSILWQSYHCIFRNF